MRWSSRLPSGATSRAESIIKDVICPALDAFTVDRTSRSLVRVEGVSLGGLFAPLDLDGGRERLAIVGRNGAAKSALVEVMMGSWW